jgi:hypothetical protein
MSEDFEQKYRGWHTKISFIKSGVRIAAAGLSIGLSLLGQTWSAVTVLAFGLLIAEVLGILEEAV